jgi:hypothetical protein
MQMHVSHTSEVASALSKGLVKRMHWMIAAPSANRFGLLRHTIQLDRFIRRHKRLLCNRANRKPSAICVCDFKVRADAERRQINATHPKPFSRIDSASRTQSESRSVVQGTAGTAFIECVPDAWAPVTPISDRQ